MPHVEHVVHRCHEQNERHSEQVEYVHQQDQNFTSRRRTSGMPEQPNTDGGVDYKHDQEDGLYPSLPETNQVVALALLKGGDRY
ncbi:hypothetical protein D3C71_1875640 [compost metagenome]